jgi:excisionase family DNA binding protein
MAVVAKLPYADFLSRQNLELSTALPNESEALAAGQSGRLLAALLGQGETARISASNSEADIVVPIPALRILVNILNEMAQGRAVTLMPFAAELTTQQAADFLNVSRPHVVALMESNQLRYRKVGTHRRIEFSELQRFHATSQVQRKAALDELTREAQELGMGY